MDFLRSLIGFAESWESFLGHAVPLLSRALCRFSAIIRYMFLNACRDKIVSSVPRYLNLCWNNSVSGNLGSRPNMIKNGLSRECSLGRKLYAAVAREHTSSHSTLGLTCLAKHVFQEGMKSFYSSI